MVVLADVAVVVVCQRPYQGIFHPSDACCSPRQTASRHRQSKSYVGKAAAVERWQSGVCRLCKYIIYQTKFDEQESPQQLLICPKTDVKGSL